MLTSFCTILGLIIVSSAIGAAAVFVIAALAIGAGELLSELKKAHLRNN